MAGPKEQPQRKYANLEKLTIEQLEKLLWLDADSPSESEDGAYVEAITEVLLKKERENPSGRLIDVEQAWREFQAHYNTAEGEDLSLFSDKDIMAPAPDEACLRPFIPRPIRRRLRRVLITAAIIVCLVVFALPPALGYENIFKLIGQWTQDTFQFMPSGGVETPQLSVRLSGDYQNLQDALDDYEITEVAAPTWIPDGFVLEDVSVREAPDFGRVEFSAFYSNQERFLSISCILYSPLDPSTTYEKDDTPVQIYMAGDVAHYVFENNGTVCAAWCSEELECSIFGSISRDDIEKIIDSIYEKSV